ncbi:Uncharacterised protein [Legionella busanensis]|uniref:Uncharacterized protein n=1 Tax=Legionella busanensis TaxID=190655 RepID=A0A378JH47_9GAMM|nr:hypothetical protein [Legionella busanensis]STX50626.1 Uncharacterised protein [Legionella busanensis]
MADTNFTNYSRFEFFKAKAQTETKVVSNEKESSVTDLFDEAANIITNNLGVLERQRSALEKILGRGLSQDAKKASQIANEATSDMTAVLNGAELTEQYELKSKQTDSIISTNSVEKQTESTDTQDNTSSKSFSF